MERVGSMQFNFTGVQLKHFKTRKVQGQKKYLVEWTYKIFMGSQDGVLRVKAFIAGKEVGSANFDFNQMEVNGAGKDVQNVGYDSDSD
jgi:hypothetical protein